MENSQKKQLKDEQSEKSNWSKKEEEILSFWNENEIFKKSLAKNEGKESFVFYDGPPFATGVPHYGHLLASIIKDAIPRYQTMKGKYVRRKWGWDCHGLPIETLIEKDLGLEHKKDIEKYGIGKFNRAAKDSVFMYDKEWKKVIPRIGRWVDMEDGYKTMDCRYTESIWWAFKELYDKGLVYKDYKSMHICPRCETTLSTTEVADGYKDITDISVTAKFELVDEPGTYVLAWTTTPWTLPGNVALAVGEDIEYVKVMQMPDTKKVFLISGKYAYASDSYYPKLKTQLEKDGFEVMIIDHIESSNPILTDNLTAFEKYDFSEAHIVAHSLGASTFLKFLESADVEISSLTMIAPVYPGKSFLSTNPDWVKNSGYIGYELDFEKVKLKIKDIPDIIYSEDSLIKEEHFLLLAEKLNANLHKEKGKDHFFVKEYTSNPDFQVTFSDNYIVAKERVVDIFKNINLKVEEIKTDRLLLSPYKKEDAEGVFELLKNENDNLFYRDIDIDKPKSIKDVNGVYIDNKNQAQWSILYKGKIIGVIEFNDEGNLRYWIESKNQKMGLMTEALVAVSEYLIDSGVLIISARVMVDNLSSEKVLKKAGFSFVKKQEYAPDDIVLIYELLNKDRINILKGKDLIGKSYKPVFDYYAKNEKLENRENGWKIYGADFVTTESGTGVVHIAPAFGEDDMNLGKKYNLPFIQHATFDGRFKDEVKDFAGMQVKPKSDDEKTRLGTDIAILRYLQEHGTFFSKLKINHSYPHCWRCDTPLLNYATSSWFIKVTEIKDKLVALNKKVNWIPETIGEGRFHNWLEGARDWSISRTRFWGSPLPVWECKKCEERTIVGSLEDLRKKSVKRNNFFVMRHGESENNTSNVASSKIGEGHHLTEKGEKQIKDSVKELKKKNIDIIISSPILRTKETAGYVASGLGLDRGSVIFDDRIKETNTGDFNGRAIEEYRNFFSSYEEMFTKTPQNGENLMDLKRRVMDFISDVNMKYSDKNILIVTHEYPSWFLFAGSGGADVSQTIEMKEERGDDFLKNAEVAKLDFVPFPHNENWELDLHRPYIDELELGCVCGGAMKRIPDVFDCWVESGSMSFAQFHYPFENKEEFENNFPADFVAEGIDQTRGWFYTSLVMNAGLFDKAPYQNVVVNGLIMAEDGKKMSKRLKNYPETWDILNKYSADALRVYMLSSPVVHAEELRFSEGGVDEVQKKVIGRVLNVLSFYKLYENVDILGNSDSKNILDKWIIARLHQMTQEIEKSLDKYELDRAVRPIGVFVDDLSTWYLRRSRGRFKSEDVKDKKSALATLRFVLNEFAKATAPIMPFLAENIYREIGGDKKSVHLENWTEAREVDEKILKEMEEVRKMVSLGLEARANAGIKVRQPLNVLKVKSEVLKDDFIVLIKDEVNIKNVVFDSSINKEVEIDIKITPELKKEGQFRELVRFIQDLRKKRKFTPSDLAIIHFETSSDGKALVEEFMNELKAATPLKSVEFKKNSEGVDFKVDNLVFKVNIER